MSEATDTAASGADWRHMLRAVVGVALDDAAAAGVAAAVARGVALSATPAPGALFDVEPSHHARALADGAPR